MADTKQFNFHELPAVKASLENTQVAMTGVVQQIEIGEDKQNGFVISMLKGEEAAGGLGAKLKEYIQNFDVKKAVLSVLDLSDAMAQNTIRLGAMKTEMGSIEELQNDILMSAQSCGISYMDMSNTVAELGTKAGGIFQSGNEMVQFAENLNKSFLAAGMSQEEMAGATQQMIQALGSGGMDSSGLDAMLETAPAVAEILQEYLGIGSADVMREMAENGQITAEVLKNSMLAATGDIQEQFQNVPLTWKQVENRMQNAKVGIFQPLLTQINQLAQNESFQAVVSSFLNGLQAVAGAAVFAFGILMNIAGFVAENWSVLFPIIAGIAAVMGIYTACVIAHSIAEGISSAVKIAATISSLAHGAATNAEMEATLHMTRAQLTFNAALLACPVTWIIIAIIAVIALIFLIVAAINKLTGSSYSAAGIIGGAFATVFAVIANVFTGVMTIISGLIEGMVNHIIVFINFFANVFKNPISSVIYLFQGLADTVLGIIEKIASGLDFVFGTNMADTIAGWREDIRLKADAMVEEYAPNENYEKVVEEIELAVPNPQEDRLAYGETYKKGYEGTDNFVSGMKDKMMGFDFGTIFGQDDKSPYIDESEYDNTGSPYDGLGEDILPANPLNDGMAENMDQTAVNTGRMADTVEMSDENLGYLKESAEREVIDRTVFSSININMGGINNTVKNLADLDRITDYLTLSLKEKLAISAEGVH